MWLELWWCKDPTVNGHFVVIVLIVWYNLDVSLKLTHFCPAHCYSISWVELFIFYKYRIYLANSNFLLLYHSNKKCGWNYDDARIQQLMVILWSLFWFTGFFFLTFILRCAKHWKIFYTTFLYTLPNTVKWKYFPTNI